MDQPQSDEIEIAVFGPGYGESIVIHIGNGKWIIVDSCLDDGSDLPAPLRYLWSLNVNVAKDVVLVVATHWHDDHIRGISGVFNACESSDFVISSALSSEEFLNVIRAEKPPIESTGVSEFTKIIDILHARKQRRVQWATPKHAIVDRLLLSREIQYESQITKVKIYSLSPSDAAVMQAKLAFAQALSGQQARPKRIAAVAPNHTSVVLWVEIGPHRILLGADLEVTSNPQTGWSVILSDSTLSMVKRISLKYPIMAQKMRIALMYGQISYPKSHLLRSRLLAGVEKPCRLQTTSFEYQI
ncbi:MAG: MBL fold metallo-hydrolase [Caldilineaceae bacterium]